MRVEERASREACGRRGACIEGGGLVEGACGDGGREGTNRSAKRTKRIVLAEWIGYSLGMTRTWWSLLLVGGLLSGCADDVETTAPVSRVFFTPDASSSGAALWLEAERVPDGVAVTLWGRELGDVFGWSAHVAGLDAALVVSSATVEERLGPAEEALYLAAPRPGDVALGGSRRAPELGDVSLAEAATLASVRLHAAGAVVSRLELAQAVVRRADGSYVGVTTAGGTLDTEGGR